MRTLILVVISVGLSVAAQFCLKAGMTSMAATATTEQAMSLDKVWALLTHPYVFGGFALYGLGAVVWLAVLSQWDVSKAYPLVGLGFALSVIIGFFTGEHVTLIRVGGVALICAGVWVVANT